MSDLVIEEIVPMAKILPVNLKNEQINERTLMNSVEDYLAGKNATVLLIGSTYSGKERVFDGYKDEQPLAEHFLLKILPILRSRFNRYDVKVRAAVAIQ